MIEDPLMLFCLLPLAAYLIAATPVGFLIGKAKGVDIRQLGSRNVGATNVGRVLGRKWGYLCFALDVLKGLLPVLVIGYLIGAAGWRLVPAFPLDRPEMATMMCSPRIPYVPTLGQQAAWLSVGVACILGHVFPFWLKFRGGKGVATSLGVVLGFYPYFTFVGLAAFAVWVVTVLIWRYVSLSSILAALAFPLLFIVQCEVAGPDLGWSVRRLWPVLAFAVAMALLVIVRHRANIARLRAGTENKILRKPK